MTEKGYDFLYKFLCVGDSGVGRSSFLLRYVVKKKKYIFPIKFELKQKNKRMILSMMVFCLL